MQIKPHQIPHFARQRERLVEIRSEWNTQPKEEGSYFSRRWEYSKPKRIAGFADLSEIDSKSFTFDLIKNKFINENNNTNTTSTNTI